MTNRKPPDTYGGPIVKRHTLLSPFRSLLRSVSSLAAGERTPEATVAFETAIRQRPRGSICVSIGGGPTVVHPRLINVNLRPFPNVQTVATAYRLPFATESVDAVHCEAVLEHLEDPELAVSEMSRVLKTGGHVFAATPFLQVFHAYPSHYQNYTLVGHRRLFERLGFMVLSSGTCVGPTFATLDIVANYCREFIPTRILSRIAYYGLRLVSIPLRLVDKLANSNPRSHALASSTFVHCIKADRNA